MNLITLFYVCVQYHQSAFHSVSVFTSSFFLSACFYPFGVTFLFACFVWYECLFFCFGFFGMCIWFLVFFYFFFTFWSLVIWIFCIYFLLSPLFSPHLFHVSFFCVPCSLSIYFSYIFALKRPPKVALPWYSLPGLPWNETIFSLCSEVCGSNTLPFAHLMGWEPLYP